MTLKLKAFLRRAANLKTIPMWCPSCGCNRQYFPVHLKGCQAQANGLCPSCLHPENTGELHWHGCPIMGGEP